MRDARGVSGVCTRIHELSPAPAVRAPHRLQPLPDIDLHVRRLVGSTVTPLLPSDVGTLVSEAFRCDPSRPCACVARHGRVPEWLTLCAGIGQV